MAGVLSRLFAGRTSLAQFRNLVTLGGELELRDSVLLYLALFYIVSELEGEAKREFIQRITDIPVEDIETHVDLLYGSQQGYVLAAVLDYCHSDDMFSRFVQDGGVKSVKLVELYSLDAMLWHTIKLLVHTYDNYSGPYSSAFEGAVVVYTKHGNLLSLRYNKVFDAGDSGRWYRLFSSVDVNDLYNYGMGQTYRTYASDVKWKARNLLRSAEGGDFAIDVAAVLCRSTVGVGNLFCIYYNPVYVLTGTAASSSGSGISVDGLYKVVDNTVKVTKVTDAGTFDYAIIFDLIASGYVTGYTNPRGSDAFESTEEGFNPFIPTNMPPDVAFQLAVHAPDYSDLYLTALEYEPELLLHTPVMTSITYSASGRELLELAGISDNVYLHTLMDMTISFPAVDNKFYVSIDHINFTGDSSIKVHKITESAAAWMESNADKIVDTASKILTYTILEDKPSLKNKVRSVLEDIVSIVETYDIMDPLSQYDVVAQKFLFTALAKLATPEYEYSTDVIENVELSIGLATIRLTKDLNFIIDVDSVASIINMAFYNAGISDDEFVTSDKATELERRLGSIEDFEDTGNDTRVVSVDESNAIRELLFILISYHYYNRVSVKHGGDNNAIKELQGIAAAIALSILNGVTI